MRTPISQNKDMYAMLKCEGVCYTYVSNEIFLYKICEDMKAHVYQFGQVQCNTKNNSTVFSNFRKNGVRRS